MRIKHLSKGILHFVKKCFYPRFRKAFDMSFRIEMITKKAHFVIHGFITNLYLGKSTHPKVERKKEIFVLVTLFVAVDYQWLNAYFMLDSAIIPCKKYLNCVLILSRFSFHLQTSDIDASSYHVFKNDSNSGFNLLYRYLLF